MGKGNLIFRTATNQDTENIILLVKKILPEFELKFSPESSELDLLNIEETYIRQGGIFEVIENEENQIIGTVALLKIDRHRCKIRKMYVDKAYRRLGLGQKLMERILQKAQEFRFEEVMLETVHTMTAAIHLYEKHGFKKEETCKVSSPRCDVVMHKRIVPLSNDL